MGNILFPALPAPPGVSKATQTEWNCPVCHSVQKNSEVVPCGHEFCLGCLLRHMATSPTCPLCTRPVLSARFSMLGQNNCLQYILSPPGVPLGPSSWARRGLFRLVYTSPQPPAVQGAVSPAVPDTAGGFPSDLWAELLYGHKHLLDPVRPWLRQSLEAIYSPQWWEARQVESIALSTLCLSGPDRDILSYMLGRYLREYTAPLVHGLIHLTLHQCTEAWRLRRSQAAQEDDKTPVTATGPCPSPVRTLGPSQTPSPDTTGPSVEERPAEPSTAEPTRPTSRGRPQSAPPPAELDQPQDMQEDDVVAPRPFAPRRGRTRRTQVRAMRSSWRRRAPRRQRPFQSRRRKPKRK